MDKKEIFNKSSFTVILRYDCYSRDANSSKGIEMLPAINKTAATTVMTTWDLLYFDEIIFRK